ncbi:hypothetical protein Hanom_Chr04g00280311 [Helianthus anomalus]
MTNNHDSIVIINSATFYIDTYSLYGNNNILKLSPIMYYHVASCMSSMEVKTSLYDSPLHIPS